MSLLAMECVQLDLVKKRAVIPLLPLVPVEFIDLTILNCFCYLENFEKC